MPVIVVCERCGEQETYSHVGRTKMDPLGQAGADALCDLRDGVTCSTCTAWWRRWLETVTEWREQTLRDYAAAATRAWIAGEDLPPVPPPPTFEEVKSREA